MFDVVAIGELLIDFTPSGLSGMGNPLYEQNPGGAPANVLAAMAKLGKKGAFIGMVGKDQFGIFLREVLRKNGVEVKGLKSTNAANTTLAFVHLDQGGDRSFSFYRNPGADMMLSPEDVDYDLIKQAGIFHFGSVSMTGEPSRSATLAAAKFAKENGLIVSYDPNYRPLLWKNEDEAKRIMNLGLDFADILKISEGELELLTGTDDPEKGSAVLFEKGINVICVTLGPQGCFYRYSGGAGKKETYDVEVIDTTGAGDAFLGGVLYHLGGMSSAEIGGLSKTEFEKIIDFANAMGALTTTKKGAIPAMPDLAEIARLMNKAAPENP